MWREFEHLRRLGVELAYFSTRRPPPADAARHSFAVEASRRTVYLWPVRARSFAVAALMALRHPIRAARAAAVAIRIPDRHGRRSLRGLGLLGLGLLLAKELRARGCRYLHVHSAADSSLIAMFAGMVGGIPYSVVVNANLGWWGGSLDQKLGRASLVFAHARWIHDDILKSVPEVAPERLVLAPVGVDIETWEYRPPRAECSPPLRLIAVGRLHPNKGHAVTIRAVHRLRDSGLDVRLRILGGGAQRDELTELIRSLGLESDVELLGSVSEDRVKAELADADIFVLPSEWEPLGVVYMEAMAAGVPVIGTREGGVTEVVRDGRTGFLVDPRSVEEIVAAVTRLANDGALRGSMSREGRASIEESFDSRIGARRVFETIRMQLEGGSSVGAQS